MLELGGEGVRPGAAEEAALLVTPAADGVDHAVDDLAQRRLAARTLERATEVLLGQDVGGVEAPAGRHLDPELLEGDRSVSEVGDAGVAPLPGDLVVGMHALGCEMAADADPHALGCDGHSGRSPLLRSASRWRRERWTTRCGGPPPPGPKMLNNYSTVVPPMSTVGPQRRCRSAGVREDSHRALR